MRVFQIFRKWLKNNHTADSKKCIYWLIGICAFFAFVWTDSVSPNFYWAGWAAIEYALVAFLMGAAAGFGRATYDELHEKGMLAAVKLAMSGLFLVAIGFAILSICLKPGFPLYLLTLKRGRGVCIVILCSAIYGYFAHKRDNSKLK
jgi:hypothetical protein